MYIIMDGSKKIMVTSGPYQFQIIDNTLYSRDNTQIYSRNFILEGEHPDCVNISVIYENNKPVYASMPILLSDTEYSFVRRAILVIKILLQYISTQLPTLTHIRFYDKSSIECATEEEIIPLYYFSIAFNGQTWYEKHFNATQKDEVRHQEYRKKVDEFLYSPDFKANMGFDKFVSLFDKREEEMSELYQYYNNTNNFNDFFQSIPKQHRCRLVGPWIEQFMKFILKDVFYNEHWIIHLPMEISGGIRNKKKHNKTRKYYHPKGIITNNYQSTNICLTPDDI